jgi:hypothetical protein
MRIRAPFVIAITLAAVTAACATARQFLALRRVNFDIDNVARVLVAGVPVERVRSYSDLSALEIARLAAAATRGEIPLEFDLLVGGENPADNNTTARLVRMTWTLLLNNTETISGAIDTAYTFAPGQRTIMRVPIRLDLVRFFRSSGRDAFELACGIANLGGCRPTTVEVRALPTVDTPLGPIQYDQPITIVRRTTGTATTP